MHIGNLEIPAGAGLSPMAGVTDAAMRLLCFEMGAAWAHWMKASWPTLQMR